MHPFLNGATSALCAAAAMFFVRFWRESEDPLFANFAAAFVLLALNYAILGTVQFATESRPFVFLLRFSAFAMILIGVGVKNRT